MTVALKFDPAAQTRPVTLPTSKSIAARALILSFVYGNSTRIEDLPDCDDTRELSLALSQLSSPSPPDFFNLGTGATSLRFFLALAASLPGVEAVVDCSDALRKRPLSPLLDALRAAGADIAAVNGDNRPPFKIRGRLLDGSDVHVESAISSQFASAVMLVSDLWTKPPHIDVGSLSVSRPYLTMTTRMRGIFRSRPDSFRIEPDWSAASYFYEYALLLPGFEVNIANMPPLEDSLQGDSACARIFARFGVKSESGPDGSGRIVADPLVIDRLSRSNEVVVLNMCDTPDLVPALAVGLCFAGIKFRLTGIAHLRHKESDRLEALTRELSLAGFALIPAPDSLIWLGAHATTQTDQQPLHSSHGDHRIAMSLAITALTRPQVLIEGADAITKSFPTFFANLPALLSRLPQH